MADPVVAVALYAETRGYIQFESCDGSRRWWVGARARLRTAKRDMDARCSEIEARRLFSEMALGGIDTSESRKIAQNAQLRFESTVKPWVKAELAAAQGGDDLDLMASWYIMYQPELLKRLGVNFAKLESVHRG